MLDELLKKTAGLLLSVEQSNNPYVVRARLETCKLCPKYEGERDRCSVCGCFMDTKTKLMTSKNPRKMGRVEITHCPQGLWGDKVIANLYRSLDGKPPL